MARKLFANQRSLPTTKAALLDRSCRPAHDAHGLSGRCTIAGRLEGSLLLVPLWKYFAFQSIP
jgi:hypothetical protein